MSQIEFEPFGERMHDEAGPSKTPGIVEHRLLKAGVGAFWVLVAGIVIARALFFNPDFAQVFNSVAHLSGPIR